VNELETCLSMDQETLLNADNDIRKNLSKLEVSGCKKDEIRSTGKLP
jgi:hypothetical protein